MESFYGGRSGAPFVIVKRFDCIDADKTNFKSNFYQYYLEESTGVKYYVLDGSNIEENNFIVKISAGQAGQFTAQAMKNDGSKVNVGYYDINGDFHPLSEQKALPFEPVSYVVRYLAVNEETLDESKLVFKTLDGNFIYRQTLNEADYAWHETVLDGRTVKTVDAVTGIETELALESIELQGMLQCFKEGAETASEVNYGEYVIIDTIVNCHNASSSENGMVFRRGMNYQDLNAILPNRNYGAEYIGQIVGPKGDSPELALDRYKVISQWNNHNEGEYSLTDSGRIGNGVDSYGNKFEYFIPTDNADLIPGIEDPSRVDENGNRIHHKTVKYAWVTLKDQYGNTSGCMIGFQVPYLVEEFNGHSVSAYYNRSNNTGNFENKNLTIRVDDRTNPFYQKWDLAIPKGIKGDTFKNFRIEDIGGKARVLVDYYNYDAAADPTAQLINLGAYNIIEDILIAGDGTLTVKYSHDDDKVFEKKLKWVTQISVDPQTGSITYYYNTGDTQTETNKFRVLKDVSIQTNLENDIEGSGNQLIHVNYNTILEEGQSLSESIGKPINYVIESVVTSYDKSTAVPSDHLLIYFSDPELRNLIGSYTYPSDKFVVVSDAAGISYTVKKDEVVNNTITVNGESVAVTNPQPATLNNWYDAGPVHGSVSGIKVLKTVELNEGQDGLEYLNNMVPSGPGSDMDGDVDKDYSGWAYSVVTTYENSDGETVTNTDIYMYDYANGSWYLATTLKSISSVGMQVYVSPIDKEPNNDQLVDNGIWFIEEDAYFGYDF